MRTEEDVCTDALKKLFANDPLFVAETVRMLGVLGISRVASDVSRTSPPALRGWLLANPKKVEQIIGGILGMM